MTTSPAHFLQDWLEGWNGHDLDRIMLHYAEDATFQSPSVMVLHPESGGLVRGRAAIRTLYGAALARYPKLRFEMEDVIERPYGVIAIYRKWGVFSDAPGLTVEVFELEGGLVRRNVVYWGVEEVVSRFQRGSA
jgi:hypothetical protein